MKRINLSHDKDDSKNSATKIVYDLYPNWKDDETKLEFETFSQGKTNTMLKITHAETSLVFRAFGTSADPLTSRPREIATHGMFAAYGLAPQLLARFDNGLIMEFSKGETCEPKQLSEERVWRGVARNLAYWHAILPVGIEGTEMMILESSGQGKGGEADGEIIEEVKKDRAAGDIWAVLKQWAERIPVHNEDDAKLKERLQEEVQWTFEKLGDRQALNGQKLVMGHCDLLSGNVLIQNPQEKGAIAAKVQFIDYEYSVACNAAFDIAQHFGEWCGFECDYTLLPPPETRKSFIREYVEVWRRVRAENEKSKKEGSSTVEDDVVYMSRLVDEFRALPGLWFGLWSLVQKDDESDDFDFGEYAGIRLAEFWTWKGVEPLLPVGKGSSDPKLRDSRWFG